MLITHVLDDIFSRASFVKIKSLGDYSLTYNLLLLRELYETFSHTQVYPT